MKSVAASLILMSLPLTIQASAKNNDTALIDAARKGDAKKASSLLAHASPDAATRALVAAATFGRLGVVEVLVAGGVDPNREAYGDPNGSQHLGAEQLSSTEWPILNMVGLLNFWASSGGPTGHTPLIEAARAGKLEIVDWLVSHGAGIDLRGKATYAKGVRKTGGVTTFTPVVAADVGNSALSAAVLARHVDVVDLLLKHGADPSRQVQVKNAEILGISGFMPPKNMVKGSGRMPYSGGLVFENSSCFLRQSADGTITTNLVVNPGIRLSVDEWMDLSEVPAIRAFAHHDVSREPMRVGSAFTLCHE